MSSLAVFLVSAAPAAGFLLYILWMDRREPEPPVFVVKAFLLGAAACLPAMIVEGLLDFLPFFGRGGWEGAVLVSFVQVAPVEEGCKLLAVLLFLWKSPNFNEENDGVVSVGTAALGFAFLENWLYVAREGLGVGVLRAFTSVPLHVSTGIVLGYHAGLFRFEADPEKGKRVLAKGFLIAWAMHGAYDSFALSGSTLGLLLLPLVAGVCLLAALYARRGRRLSLARWGAASQAPAGTSPGTAAPSVRRRPGAAGRPSRAPIVVSRILFGLVVLFWALLYAGLMTPEAEGGAGEAVLGGVVLTFLPAALGVFLEVAHARSRRRAAAAGPAYPFRTRR